MDTKKLRYFVMVINKKSYTEAAKHLLIAQPALSRSVQNLENELGLNLIDRSKKGVELTAEGEILYNYAIKILSMLDQAEIEISKFQKNRDREIRIAVPYTFNHKYFSLKLIQFMKANPSIKITLHEEGMTKIPKLIHEEHFDFGVVDINQEDSALEITPLINEELVVCVASTHQFKRLSAVPLQQLLSEPLILVEEKYLKIIKISIQRDNPDSTVLFRTNNEPFISAMVEEKIGVALVMKSSINETSRIQIRPLSPQLFINIGLVRLAGKSLSPSAKLLFEYIQSNIMIVDK